METARCRAFVAAAETGSFSKAAEALSYTPSGVNQLVTALEKEFGFPLFRRNTKGVALTENGELLLPVIRKFLRQEDRIFELSAEMNGLLIGSVNIAAYSSIATHWLPAVIGAFQRDYPQIHINLLEGIWQEVSSGWMTGWRISDSSAIRRTCPMSGSLWRRIPCWRCCREITRWPGRRSIRWPTAPQTGSSCPPRAAMTT